MIERLTQNWWYKFVALVTAVSLWAFVHNQRNPAVDRTMQVPLNVLKDKSYTVTSAPDDITVVLSGPKPEVDKVKVKDLYAWVDLMGRSAGTHSVQVRIEPKERRDLPENVHIRVNQLSYKLTLESISNRTLPIDVNFVNLPPVGYTYDEPKVVPSTASINGRSSVIESIHRLVVAVDPSAGPDFDVDRTYQVTALDAVGNEIKGIDINPSKVRVRLDVVAVPARKSVFVSPSVVGQPQYPFKVVKVSVSPETVIVKGKPASLFDMSTLSTEDVNVEGATGSVVREVDLRVLPGIEVEGQKKVRVLVRIESRQDSMQ